MLEKVKMQLLGKPLASPTLSVIVPYSVSGIVTPGQQPVRTPPEELDVLQHGQSG